MATVDVISVEGKKSGTVELPESLFGVEVNVPLIHQVVVAQLAAARQGTHKAKTRSEVSGSGKKPFKQKGTGNARQGSTRAPQMVGGGIVFGPQPRDYTQRTPKKMKAGALFGALSDRAANGLVKVVTELVSGDQPSTKQAAANLAKITQARSSLVVITREEEVAELSLRNLPQVHLLYADQLNPYDVLVNDDVIFTKAALEAFVSSRVKGDEK